ELWIRALYRTEQVPADVLVKVLTPPPPGLLTRNLLQPRLSKAAAPNFDGTVNMGFSKLFDFFQTSTCIASPPPPPTALEGLLLSSPAGLIPSLTPTGKPKACSGSIFASPATISNACGKKRYLSGANPDSPSHRPNPVPEQQDPYPSTATIWVQSIVATLVQLSRLVTAGSSSPGQVATCILYTTCTYICDYLAEIQSSTGSSQYASKGFTRKSGPPEVEMSKNKADNIHGARRPRMRACQTAV
ncbi:hypothetical protein CTAM01_06731, partial [Colletotrichum tamarilloi]